MAVQLIRAVVLLEKVQVGSVVALKDGRFHSDPENIGNYLETAVGRPERFRFHSLVEGVCETAAAPLVAAGDGEELETFLRWHDTCSATVAGDLLYWWLSRHAKPGLKVRSACRGPRWKVRHSELRDSVNWGGTRPERIRL